MNARRLTLAVVLVIATCAMLAFMSAAAFAAAPEAPEVTVEAPVAATSATLHGVLNPGKAGEEGTYVFLYKESTTEECEGGSQAPGSPGLSFGFEREEVSEGLSGLTPGTEYAVCLRIESTSTKEVAVSPAVSFETAITPEAPEAASAEPLTSTTATLHGLLNPHGTGNAGDYEFLYRQVEPGSEPECQGGSTTPPEAMSGSESQTVEAPVTGLLPNATYSFCLLARNEAGETATSTPPVTFTTTAIKPTLEAETATNVTETTATLNAKVNPNGAQITTCTFQYGTDTGYGHTAPCTHPDAAELGAGHTPVAVSASLTGLSAATHTYHWRLIASNTAGTETGVDHTFIDETAAGTLPDGRQYELVTPPHKNAGLVGFAFGSGSGWPVQIAPDGRDMIVLSIPCLANTHSCTAARERQGEPYEFARTSEGWVTHPLAPPLNKFEESSLWSADPVTHTALFSAPTPPAGAGPDNFYIGSGEGEPLAIGPVGESHVAFEKLKGQMDATRGFSHVVYFGTRLWSLDGALETEASLYEYAGTGGAHPLAVGVTGGEGSTSLISGCGTFLGGGGQSGSGGVDQYGALSEDGRTVVFTASGCGGPEELYARVDGERSDAHTVAISRPVASSCGVACQAAPDQGGAFAGASRDGSRVLFTSRGQLTDNASQSIGRAGAECQNAAGAGCNLYESVCAEPCGQPGEEPNAKERELVDVSEGAKSTGGPRVQGVMALSPDGSHVYFVARGVLTESTNAQGHVAQDGSNNLYVHVDGQPLKFIATLPQDDENVFPESENAFEWTEGLELANVTPDGRFLVFLSHGALTGDDTRPDRGGNSATPPAQVYRYDSQTGVMVRISIGEHGFNDDGNSGALDAGIAPAKVAFNLGVGPARANPTVSADGEYVFFESPVALAAGALNEVEVPYFPGLKAFAENVYEYHDGTVSLISDGRDTSPKSIVLGIPSSTRLLGSSESGADVFFATDDALTSQDTDTQRDYYDARICTTAEPCFTPPSAPPVCEGEACQGEPGAPPALSAPSSSVFSGAGNLVLSPSPVVVKPKSKMKSAKCKKGFVERHGKCMRSKSKKKAKKAKKASDKRRIKS